MTGPEAYKEAIRLTQEPDCRCEQTGCAHETARLARGLVLATAALAAATALNGFSAEGTPQADRQAWYRTASEGPGEKERTRAAREAERAEFAQEVPA